MFLSVFNISKQVEYFMEFYLQYELTWTWNLLFIFYYQHTPQDKSDYNSYSSFKKHILIFESKEIEKNVDHNQNVPVIVSYLVLNSQFYISYLKVVKFWIILFQILQFGCICFVCLYNRWCMSWNWYIPL